MWNGGLFVDQSGDHRRSCLWWQVVQRPGSWLRIVQFEGRDKFSVRQVLELRSIVGHDVDLPWEEACLQAVAVVTLVGAG
jgi:hypothetical protein